MYDDLLDNFDVSGLDASNTVVRCDTQEEADILLKYLNAKGVWSEQQISSLSKRWADYGSSTCYHLSLPSWCYVDYYKRNYPEWCIVDFCHIYQQSLEEPSLEFSFDELMQGII